MMRCKNFSASWLLAPMLALWLGACHLVDGPHGGRQETWYYCDETGCYLCNEFGCELPSRYCSRETCCPPGMSWDSASRVCRTRTGCTTSSQCGPGLICQSGACVPGKVPCDSNESCGDGAYCSNGTCKNTCRCSTDSECAKYGSNFVCDDRGSCVPAPQPAGCQNATACVDGLCLDGSCGTCSGDCGGGNTCQFNNHCGTGRVCLNGQCTSSCTKPEDCGSAQICKSTVCVQDTSGFCLKSADCGGGKVCLNNTCYASCSGTCTSPKDVCSAPITVGGLNVRLCMPDRSARPECKLTKDCLNGEQCVNGICRTVCTKTEDCANCPDGPVCGKGGFCMTAIENTPQCTTNAQCAGKVCLNGQCVTL